MSKTCWICNDILIDGYDTHMTNEEQKEVHPQCCPDCNPNIVKPLADYGNFWTFNLEEPIQLEPGDILKDVMGNITRAAAKLKKKTVTNPKPPITPTTFETNGRIYAWNAAVNGNYAARRDEYGDAVRERTITEGVGAHNANLIVSMDQRGYHQPVIDIDGNLVRLIPSTTPGNYHLYLDKPMTWDDYTALLAILRRNRYIEAGWYESARRHGYTAVRPPWVHKGDTVDLDTPLPTFEADAELDERLMAEHADDSVWAMRYQEMRNQNERRINELTREVADLTAAIKDLQETNKYLSDHIAARQTTLGWS